MNENTETRTETIEDARPWEPLNGRKPCVGDEVRHERSGITTTAVVARVDEDGDLWTAEGAFIGPLDVGTWYVRRAVEEPLPDPDVEAVENATLDDVRSGVRLTQTRTLEYGGLTLVETREGIAHHRDWAGNWCTKEDQRITDGIRENTTLTIRRPVRELPTEYDGAVLVPADGCSAITTTKGQEFARLTFTTKQDLWYGPNLAARPGDWVIHTTTADRLTPGTWKVDDQ